MILSYPACKHFVIPLRDITSNGSLSISSTRQRERSRHLGYSSGSMIGYIKFKVIHTSSSAQHHTYPIRILNTNTRVSISSFTSNFLARQASTHRVSRGYTHERDKG